MATNRKKIVRYRKPFQLQPGIVILVLTIIYVIVYLCIYLSREPASIYEVTYGSTAESGNASYTGIALRDETVYYAEQSGYLNFYVRDGSRVSMQSTLYSIDEKGTVSSLLKSMAQENNTLSDEDLLEIKQEISDFSAGFDPDRFTDVYDFKFSLNAQLMEAVTANTLDKIYETIDKNSFSIHTSPQTGIVTYYTDNYESYSSIENVTSELFDTSHYVRNSLSSNDMVAANDPIFKVVSGEEWSIVIPLSQDEAELYSDTSRIGIVFKNDGLKATGRFNVVKKDDGYYGVISLNQYMLRYLSERFLEISISSDSDQGLKIPKSAVFDEEFYLVPKSYYCKGGDKSDTYGFNLEVFDSNGNTTLTFITPEVYYSTDEYCYISKTAVNNGDILVMPDSNERYQINQIGTLQGVFQINSGYTAFKRIEILSETAEYYIISDKTSNGLIIYDHILLEKGNFEENDIIY